MGDIKEIQEAIEARMVAMGFTQTKEVFNFDEIPNSIIHKAFRIETALRSNPYYSGNISNPKETIDIWIAYKIKRDALAADKLAKDDRESIEVDLINHSSISELSSNPILMFDQEGSTAKYLANYLVSLLSFTVDYVRDVSSS